MIETPRQRKEHLIQQLKNERSSFTSHWTELSEYILPRRSRFLASDTNKGDKRHNAIVDNTATLAARTLRSGMMTGVTSPARPWFRLTTPDPDLAEWGPVKQWLHVVTQRMTTVFLRSNLYQALPILYGDMGTFATSAMMVVPDPKSVIRCYPYPIGSYLIAQDHRLVVDTFAREFQMTVRQLVAEFGIDNVTHSTRHAWENGNLEQWVEVVHVIEPNHQADPRKLDARFKAWVSCYFETGATGDEFLRVSGFDEFPVLAPRWEVTGEDVWGTSCPGMECLGDVKMLQAYEKKCAKAVEKMIDPPVIAPDGLTHAVTLLPGEVTVATAQEGEGIRPLHEVNIRINELEAKSEQTRQRIRRAYYEDLFLMLANDTRAQRATATEIAERHEEKLLALGPVLERLNQDLLNPLIDRTFNIMMRAGLIPPPPQEVRGQELKVEYISIMAQAQKMVATASTERFMGFVGNLAAAKPDVLDKVDLDQAVDEYGDMMGVPPRLIRPDEQVAEIRQQRAAQQAAMEQAAIAQQAAQGAKTLSETDVDSDNALTRLLGAGG